jgi:hypothetical protein
MKGTIFKINHNRGMVAVLTENGDFSIFELLGGDPAEEGDEVYWKNDTGLGSEQLRNITQEETFEVYFQNHWVSNNQLSRQLLY